MKQIKVTTSVNYDVLIGTNILPIIGQQTADLVPGRTAAIISDANVWPLYGHIVTDSLEKAAFRVVHFIMEPGEEQKNLQTYSAILDFLAQSSLSRNDVIIALGGGVVGDLAGFAAATYLRGIRYVQVPTTLLAMVDSSVGGKTAINLSVGKNLAGVFYQPILVICDTAALDTLPEHLFREGTSEILKYGILYDASLFCHLSEQSLAFERETVIARCIGLKANVVSEDELDKGARMLLNLGHTVAHAIERISNFTTSHGDAVAMGIAIISRAAAGFTYCSQETANLIVEAAQNLGLPVTTQFTASQIYASACTDKKRLDGFVNLIVPEAIGSCRIVPFELSKLQAFLEAGM